MSVAEGWAGRSIKDHIEDAASAAASAHEIATEAREAVEDIRASFEKLKRELRAESDPLHDGESPVGRG